MRRDGRFRRGWTGSLAALCAASLACLPASAEAGRVGAPPITLERLTPEEIGIVADPRLRGESIFEDLTVSIDLSWAYAVNLPPGAAVTAAAFGFPDAMRLLLDDGRCLAVRDSLMFVYRFRLEASWKRPGNCRRRFPTYREVPMPVDVRGRTLKLSAASWGHEFEAWADVKSGGSVVFERSVFDKPLSIFATPISVVGINVLYGLDGGPGFLTVVGRLGSRTVVAEFIVPYPWELEWGFAADLQWHL